MKITITNCFTWYNKGDAGIVQGTIETLKNIFGTDIEINILSYMPNEDSKRFLKDKNVKGVYSNMVNPYNQDTHRYEMSKKALAINIIKDLIQVNINKTKFLNNNKTMQILENSDLIVAVGGGYLGGENLGSNIMHLNQIYMNTKVNKPVILWGTSIEPTNNKKVDFLIKYITKRLTHIFPRETITYKYLDKFLPKDRITLIPDLAFSLTEESNISFEFIDNLNKKFDKLIGLTVRSWNFPNSQNPERDKESYINSIVDMIINCAQKYNAAVIFVPQVIFKSGCGNKSGCGDDDSITAEHIKNRLPEEHKDNFIIRRDDWSPTEIKALIKNFDIFVGTRMHSNIFATSICVPTVAIAYERKTNGIMETLGLDEYVINIDEITSEILISKVEQAIADRYKIIEHLSIRIPKIRENILVNSQKIKDLV